MNAFTWYPKLLHNKRVKMNVYLNYCYEVLIITLYVSQVWSRLRHFTKRLFAIILFKYVPYALFLRILYIHYKVRIHFETCNLSLDYCAWSETIVWVYRCFYTEENTNFKARLLWPIFKVRLLWNWTCKIVGHLQSRKTR